MSQWLFSRNNCTYKTGLASVVLFTTMAVQAAPTVNAIDNNTSPATPSATASQETIGQETVGQETAVTTANTTPNNTSLAAQLQPSNKALSDANQELLSRNAQLQRQVNDLQTQANVLVYESKGQLFLYGAFTVLISLLVGIFVSWLVFVRRERW